MATVTIASFAVATIAVAFLTIAIVKGMDKSSIETILMQAKHYGFEIEGRSCQELQ